MSRSDMEKKYIREALMTDDIPHPEVTAPRLALRSGADGFGSPEFRMTWWAITEPFEMVSELHAHDFDQFVIFVGGDLTNMVDLGGEVELTLSEDGINRETFVFTEARTVYIPKGLFHCPLNFKKINDPAKPILFHDLFFASKYMRT